MRVNREKEAALSADYLRSILEYDHRTGLFVRTKTTRGGSGVAGRVVGSPHHSGYLHIWVGKYQYLVHRLAWLWVTGDWPSNQIDHINGDKSDNRWCNLRLATHGQNRQNSRVPRNNTSGYTGVHFQQSSKKWQAYIREGGNRIHLGYFTNRNDAVMCRNYHAAYLYGDFARLGECQWTHD